MTESNLTVNVTGKGTAKTSVNTSTDSPTVVNFFGGPGAGKSTTAAALFTLLKLHDEVHCELVTEFAKDLVWEERHKTFENQFYMFAKQQHRVWRVADKVDFTITDSPILLSNIYGEHYNRYCANTTFYDYVLMEFNRYNNINFFIERKKGYAEAGRNESEQEAIIIDKKIKDYLTENSIECISINGDMAGINTAVDTILTILERKSQYEIIRK
jgi:hypothetical protein